MRHLSFRVLFLCVFLPPVLYIFTIQGLETYFQSTWRSGLRNSLVSNMDGLMSGQVRLSELVQKNISDYFRSKWAARLGAKPQVVVRTREGRLVYPVLDFEEQWSRGSGLSLDRFPTRDGKEAIARRNMKILREGLVVTLSVQIPRNTWLANIVLVFYILIFSSILFYSYQSRARQAEQASKRQQAELEAAQERLRQAQFRLEEVAGKEERRQQEIDRLKSELEKADTRIQATEEEALQELERLEQKLQESVSLREAKEREIRELSQEIEQLESVRKSASRKKDKEHAQILKRFQTLYKNLVFDERAAEGFLELPPDMQLKAEEVIHNMNEDSSRVQVKRKVFSKKGSTTAFETVFAYKGRLYWRKDSEGRTEILAIGTKNTQNRDLAYLESL